MPQSLTPPCPADSLLVDGAHRLGVPLDGSRVGKLLRYQELLAAWGAKINLTALRDPQDVVIRHFLDSLALVRALPPASKGARLIDVGSGAGFPGVLCALLRPDLDVTLVERIGKKAAFLMALRRELGLTYAVEAADAERLIPRADGTPRGFAIAVARAVLHLPDWLRLGARLIEAGGQVYAMTTPHEPPLSAALLAGSGLDPEPTCDTQYDVGGGPRRILAFRKN